MILSIFTSYYFILQQDVDTIFYLGTVILIYPQYDNTLFILFYSKKDTILSSPISFDASRDSRYKVLSSIIQNGLSWNEECKYWIDSLLPIQPFWHDIPFKKTLILQTIIHWFIIIRYSSFRSFGSHSTDYHETKNTIISCWSYPIRYNCSPRIMKRIIHYDPYNPIPRFMIVITYNPYLDQPLFQTLISFVIDTYL